MKTTALAFLFLLAACGGNNLQQLRDTRLTGDPFNSSLAKEYRGFAEDLTQAQDVADADYFAHKGLLAANGIEVLPEALPAHGLAQADLTSLESARSRLLALRDAQHKAQNPAVLARAQFGFDCWVVQVKQSVPQQEQDCREVFTTAMESLGEASPVPEATSVQPASTTYLVLFATDQSELDAHARDVLDLVLSDDLTHPAGIYSLKGYADRTGSEAHNMRLSEARALAVRNYLLIRGIEAKRMEYFAFGETHPAVETADGVSEARNRRVEILLQ